MSSTDLTARARIRDAALTVVAEKGVARATVRQIAQRADVSAGLVIHHFGSKDGLLAACDDYVHAILAREKTWLASGGNFGAMESHLGDHPEYGPLLGYLTAVLREGGAPAARIFGLMCEATREILSAGIQAGTIRPPADMDAAIVTMVAYSCGVGLMGELIAGRLGGATLMDPQVSDRYGRAALDLFTYGLFTTDAFLTQHTQHPPKESE